MAEPMYFQWQNKFLLETIYPRRNRKLADFLIYCREIELWEQYRQKDIGAGEIAAYRADRDEAVMTAYKTYKTEYDYFKMGDVRTAYKSKYRLSDEEESILAPLKELHSVFQRNLTDRQTVRREKVLVAYYVTFWQQRIRNVEEEVKRLERRLTIMHPEHRDRTLVAQQIQQLKEVTLGIMNDELGRLLSFLSAFNRVEKRKLEFHQKRDTADKEIGRLEGQLNAVRAPRNGLQEKAKKLAADLARLHTPPQRSSFEGYFFTDDVSEELGRQFPHAAADLIQAVGGIHKRLAAELRALQSDEVRRVRLRNFVDELRSYYNRIVAEASRLEAQVGGRSMDEAREGEKRARLQMLKDEGLRAVETELDKLSNYHAAMEYEKKTPADLAKPIQETERELQRVRDQLATLEKQAASLEQDLNANRSVLDMTELSYLVSFTDDQPVTKEDIVRGKVEKYKATLEEKLDSELPEEIQQELLEEIVQLFLAKPGEYPPWLQYMVIHFSGMRYATAHGSWADPKDLLTSLRTSSLEKDFRKMDDDAVEALIEERLAVYETPDPARAPKLALATDTDWQKKVEVHLQKLKRPYDRRDALLGLFLEEQRYEIESLSPAEALAALETMKEEKNFPDWMWKEIVRLTDLRVKEVNDREWEKLTKEEQDEKNEARYAEFRAIMNKWKQDHLTGWREEHDQSNRLIVTRSVCNEVAEQILHLRGHSPSGGLTGIVDWYLRIVKDVKTAGDPGPYIRFVKKGVESYYRTGANILWLRFVHELPNAWRVAKPMEINGDRLIPENYRSREGRPDEWTYYEDSAITRRRTRTVERRLIKDQQWLRWMHVATVAKVAETADGPVVLTFETALPYDDPSVSAVGIFKHDLQNLMWDGGEEYYNGSFVAYLPDGQLPAKDLEEMLDWNHILLRQVMTPAQLEDYRKKYVRGS